MTATPCPHARSAAEFITTRAVLGVEKYGHTLADAALSPAALVRHAREEAADLLVYLTALEAALSWQPIETAPRDGREILCFENGIIRVCRPKQFNLDRWEYFRNEQFCPGHTFSLSPSHWMPLPSAPEPEHSGYYECLSDKPSGTWDEAFKPERDRPAVTREDVMRVITATGYSNCLPDGGSCLSEERCSCARTIDAIMALIGGAP